MRGRFLGINIPRDTVGAGYAFSIRKTLRIQSYTGVGASVVLPW